MKICILCEDSKVDLARQNSIGINANEIKNDVPVSVTRFKERAGIPLEAPQHLSIPVSETGELPATHWFCFMNVSDEGYAKLLSVQEHSIIEEGSPKEFLAKWNLQIIK